MRYLRTWFVGRLFAALVSIAVIAPARASPIDEWIDKVSANLYRKVKTHPCATSSWKLHEYVDRASDSLRRDIRLVWISIPRTCARLSVKTPNLQGDIAGIFDSFRAEQPIAVITGGFFRKAQGGYFPEGLHISNNIELVPLTDWGKKRPVAGGIIGSDSNGLRIVGAQEWLEKRYDFVEALQSKPLLLDKGKCSTVDNVAAASRLAVATDDAGGLHVFAVLGDGSNGISLHEFCLLLSSFASHARISRLSALNLDGGPSVRIYIPRLNRFFGRSGNDYVASLLVLGGKK